MKLALRVADMDDVEELIDMRLGFSLTMHPSDDKVEIAELEVQLKTYFDKEVKEGRYIGILGYFNNLVVSAAGLIVFQMPPTIGNYDRKTGLIVNVYTKPLYRKEGFGKETIEFLIKVAKEKGIKKLCLNATPEGENIYRKLGFKEDKYKELVLEI